MLKFGGKRSGAAMLQSGRFGLTFVAVWFAVALVAPVAAAESSAEVIEIAGARVTVEFADTDFRGGLELIKKWIKHSGDVVAGYYGRFPVPQLRMRVSMMGGGRVGGGTTFGGSTPFIRVAVGRDVTEEVLHNDWVLVHEMIHLALPDLDRKHIWLEEGIATYVEGIAHVQSGDKTEQKLWAEFVRDMPQGLPQAGDQGLDNTHTWGRTYWGGALFCLLADVEIREKTENRFGLQDALRAILKETGGIVVDGEAEKVLAIGDQATGTSVLQDLYSQMKDKAVPVDLEGLWRQLGVAVVEGRVELAEQGPLVAIRRGILVDTSQRR